LSSSRPMAMASVPAKPASLPLRGGPAAQSVASSPHPPGASVPARPAAAPLVPEGGIPVAVQAPPVTAGQQSPSEASFWEQVKNVLAAVGAIAILLHSLRLFAVTPASQPNGGKDGD
jgi:hypothetical protein